jgi:hypothetical protein
MMHHAAAFGRGRFRGADVHAAVELHGVGVNNFTVEKVRQRHRQLGLAGRRRSHDGQHPLGHGGHPNLSVLFPAARLTRV